MPRIQHLSFAEMIRPLEGEDLREFNRFSVWVYADAPGFYSVFVGCTLYNGGEHVMPAPGRFEGQHFVTVYPGKWQRIIWEIPDLYRDSVTGFSVNLMLVNEKKKVVFVGEGIKLDSGFVQLDFSSFNTAG